jgi:hypothetical protein
VNWSDDLNLLGPRVRTWPGSWALLIAAVLSVATMSAHRDDALAARAAEQRRLDQAAHEILVQQRRSASAFIARSASAPAPGQLQAAAALVERMNHPWGPILSGIEAAGGNVALLELRHSVIEPAVELEAAVADDAAAWTFVQALGADRSPFDQASLRSREPMSPATARAAVRVRVQARLAAAKSTRAQASR